MICACKSSSLLSSQVFFDLDLGLLLAAEEAEEPRLVSAKLVFLPLVPFPLCALLGVSSVVLVVSPALYLLTFTRTLLLSVVSVLATTSVCDEDWLLPVTVKSTSSESGGFLCYLNGHNINTNTITITITIKLHTKVFPDYASPEEGCSRVIQSHQRLCHP